jgi:hypothetical protein
VSSKTGSRKIKHSQRQKSKVMNKELDTVTQEDWASCTRHAENLQEEDFSKEIRWDKILEPIVINL